MTAFTSRAAQPALEAGRLALLVAICTAVALLEGFDIQSISIAAPVLITDFGIDRSQMGVVFASGQAGLVLGAIVGGAAGDRFGRRNAMFVGIACFGLFCLLTTGAGGFAALCVFRALTGVGLGLVMPNLIGMAAECAPDRHRAKIVSIILAGLPAGGMVVALVGTSVLEAWGWRGLFLIGGLLPLVTLPPMLLLPSYRTAHNRAPGRGGAAWMAALFDEGRAVTTLLLWMALLLTAAVLYMMVTWLPSLMTDRGYSLQASHLSSAMFSGGGCVGSFTTGFLVDRFGYRRVLPLLYVGVLVGICGVLFTDAVPSILVSAFILGVFVVGSFYSLNGASPLYYPDIVRGLGTGAAVGFGRIGSILGPLAAGFVLQRGIGDFASGPAAIPPVAIPLSVFACVAVFLLTRRDREPIAPIIA
jgi:MFS transporter, AAHS family, 3-hydroxyphenylpropionic acid transporter